MANLEKHSKSVMREWQEGEENPIPTHARSPLVLGSHSKNRKSAPGGGRARLVKPAAPPPAPEVESGPAAPLRDSQVKRSQAASFDHLLKKSRLTKLRQPVQVKKVESNPHPVETARPARSGTSAPRGGRSR